VNNIITYISLSLPFILSHFCLFFPQIYIYTEIYSIMNYYLYLWCNLDGFFHFEPDLICVYYGNDSNVYKSRTKLRRLKYFHKNLLQYKEVTETCMFNRQCNKKIEQMNLTCFLDSWTEHLVVSKQKNQQMRRDNSRFY
jgi:hypothetical protein